MTYEQLLEMCPSKSRAGVQYIIEQPSAEYCLSDVERGNSITSYSRWCIKKHNIDMNINSENIRKDLMIEKECSGFQELFKAAYKYMQSFNRKLVIKSQKEREAEKAELERIKAEADNATQGVIQEEAIFDNIEDVILPTTNDNK